jgi:hypothetical protein
MAQGRLVAGLIVVATALFALGTALERNASGESSHHDEATTVTSATTQEGGSGEAGESPAERSTEGTRGAASTASLEESHEELRSLGIDIEAWPFVALAALASLALAAAAWLRPHACHGVAGWAAGERPTQRRRPDAGLTARFFGALIAAVRSSDGFGRDRRGVASGWSRTRMDADAPLRP